MRPVRNLWRSLSAFQFADAGMFGTNACVASGRQWLTEVSSTSQGMASILFLVIFLLLPSTLVAVEKLDFVAQPGGFQIPERIRLGACSAGGVDRMGNIYLLHRGRSPVICLDKNGKFLRAWGDDTIKGPHGLRVDRHDHIWITDVGQHVVRQFTALGEPLLLLGQPGSAGDGPDQFNKPTDVAFSASGEIYVSDGYENSRIKAFAVDGRLLRTWGEPGDCRGQLKIPHSILVDARERILVGDSGNRRIQVFDRTGNVLEIWNGITALGMAYDPKGNLFVADGPGNKILQLNEHGQIVGSWGGEGTDPGQFQVPHMLATDGDGNLIVAEVKGFRFQKLVRRQ